MTDYATLLGLIAPVFAMIGAGVFARWRGWLVPEAEGSLLKVVVNVLFPCLVFRSTLGNEALRDPLNVALPPLMAFTTISVGFLFGFYGGRVLGLRRGTGLRTFAFAVGIYNYGYIPIPLIERLFGADALAVLFVHNIGCELAIWTVGVMLVAGASWREGLKRAVNAPAVSIVLAVVLNSVGLGDRVPEPLMTAFGALGACAVPLGLLVIGATMYDFLQRPRELLEPRVVFASVLLRLGVLPVVFVLLARWLPLSVELKQVMVVQAAMPAGIMPVVLARHFGGQPITAAQVILWTTLFGVLVLPWWIKLGLVWVGL
ncbi:AEC family transporter [Opitutales bacterium ASA1]|uniref:AEC family transporter n=1 Tax=Congregicoccus parvus TaxID=3081749 RepID=UPI002B2C7BAF|nr:AEC family transporter [Opitutales bacterium ASA1]